MENDQHCAICGCELFGARRDKEKGQLKRKVQYGEDSPEGRSYRTKHHYIAKRFLGREIFSGGDEQRLIKNKRKYTFLCYNCHEELLHNPMLLPDDIEDFHELVDKEDKRLTEPTKGDDKDKLARRIELLHKVIETGIKVLLDGNLH